MKIHKSKTKGW